MDVVCNQSFIVQFIILFTYLDLQPTIVLWIPEKCNWAFNISCFTQIP